MKTYLLTALLIGLLGIGVWAADEEADEFDESELPDAEDIYGPVGSFGLLVQSQTELDTHRDAISAAANLLENRKQAQEEHEELIKQIRMKNEKAERTQLLGEERRAAAYREKERRPEEDLKMKMMEKERRFNAEMAELQRQMAENEQKIKDLENARRQRDGR